MLEKDGFDLDTSKQKRRQMDAKYDELEYSHFNVVFRQSVKEEIPAAYLFNFKPFEFDDDKGVAQSALLLFFIAPDLAHETSLATSPHESEDTGTQHFKAILVYQPYFYVVPAPHLTATQLDELRDYLKREFQDKLASVTILEKQDLEMHNHLSGKKRTVLKLSFFTVSDLVTIRNELQSIVRKNKAKREGMLGGDSESTRTGGSDYSVIVSSSEGLFTSESDWISGGGKVRVSSTDTLQSHRESIRRAERASQTMSTWIIELREYDVSYHVRVAIDNELRVSRWYRLSLQGSEIVKFQLRKDLMTKPDLRILAYDLETTKAALKFPDPSRDQIMLVSYMIDGKGFLITNREVISEDIQDFQYTPKASMEGVFTVFNMPNERKLIERFLEHIQEAKPQVFVTFNGDYFDWPFLQKRASANGLDLLDETGVAGPYKVGVGNQVYTGRHCVHMDCFYWVQRDGYLPHGSHGLKAVTRAKLGYSPVELDPEKMLPYAEQHPQQLCTYSASDAVATYYLYKKMIHDFIFALCTIVPSTPDQVLRKGSGTLCEELLMAQAFRGNILFPNKKKQMFQKFHQGHLLDSETYIGGKVECLRSGVFRDDLPLSFTIDPNAYARLRGAFNQILEFVIEKENNVDVTQQREMWRRYSKAGAEAPNAIKISEDDSASQSEEADFQYLKDIVSNYDELFENISHKLEAIEKKAPVIFTNPLIYHVDVAAMYPNIILSNRLQPVAIVKPEICASCCYNQEKNKCKRYMQWQWKGEYFPLSRIEFESIKRTLANERYPVEGVIKDTKHHWRDSSRKPSVFVKKSLLGGGDRAFHQLPLDHQHTIIRDKVKQYSQKMYGSIHKHSTEIKEDVVCMRENPFYVDTLRDFRDRRYQYKRLVKVWKKKLSQATSIQEEREAANFATLYESLQLAHKIILNSFYGYVMRKGARWYSMEMAAMVTHTGGSIIMDTRQLFDRIGMPLELDTDGIWTLLPSGFPQNYNIKLSLYTQSKNEKAPVKLEEGVAPREQKEIGFSYPCSVSNILVYDKYANNQYQTRRQDGRYEMKREMSIFFEIDGPYKCMFLPASKEEGKLLKKRYAVFQKDGRMSELKGFEMKRRGELQLIKIFQSEVFQYYLKGNSLAECYRACGEVADEWFDILESEGSYLSDQELLGYIEEMRVLSKNIQEYGEKKATSLTCAKRLAQFLGEEIIRDKHLNAKFIISAKPSGKSVAERAIPTAIFETEAIVKYKYLRKWLGGSGGGLLPQEELQIRKLLDWEYYKERMRNTVQKLIIIPAALQGVSNPCQSPSLTPPVWLSKKRIRSKEGQTELSFYFTKQRPEKSGIDDIEDIGRLMVTPSRPRSLLPQSRLELDSSNNIITTSAVLKESGNIENTTPKKVLQDTQKSGSERKEQEMKRVTSGDLIKQVPKITESFTNWLKAQKEVWKVLPVELKTQKIQRRSIRNFTVDKRMAGVSGATMTARQVAQAQINAQFYNTYLHWHILEVRETGPGIFKVFIIPQNPMNGEFATQEAIPFSLQELRVVYFNSKVKQETSHLYQQVEKALPRQKLAYYLYESIMDEEYFRENSALFDGFLGDREIEGVYETQLPLLFNVLLKLGCMAKPVFKRSRPINTGTSRQSKLDIYTSQTAQKRENPLNPDLTSHLFKTQDLLRVTALQAGHYSYLPNDSFSKAVLLHLPCSTQRGLWMLYVERKKAVHIFCVSSHPPTTFAQPNLLRAYQSSFDGDNANHELLNVSIHSYFVKTNAQVTLALDHILTHDCMSQDAVRKRQSSKRRGSQPRAPSHASQVITRTGEKPTVVVIESPIETSDLTDTPYNLSSLEELPVMRVAAHKTGGGVKMKGGLPALDWERAGTSVLTKRLVELIDYELMERLELSRFAEVPLCNLEGCDPHLQIIDILVGRMLRGEKHLLWYSAQPLPDLGRELANFQECGTGVSTNTLRLQDLYEEIIQNPEVVRPGLYRNYVVEVEIEMLAVDSLLYKKHLEGLENYIEPNFTSKQARQMIMADQDFDQYGQTHPTFKIISQLTNELYLQSLGASRQGANMAAYQVLQHLQQWFSSQSSSLYDPWLHRVLNRVMRKVLGRLLARLEELGATVVYASFYKVVIATQKHSYEEAKQQVAYMLDSIGQLDLFQKLVMIPQTYWKMLLFKDRNNYAGISEEASQVLSKMSIARHLPAAVEPEFHIIVADFLQVLFAQLKKLIAEEKAEAPLSYEKRDQELVNFAKHYISRALSQKMFQLVKVLNPRRDPDGYLAAAIPQEMIDPSAQNIPYQANLSKFPGFQTTDMTDEVDDGYKGSGYAQAEIDEMHEQVKRQLMGLDEPKEKKRVKKQERQYEREKIKSRNVLEDSDEEEKKEDELIELDIVKQEYSDNKKWQEMEEKGSEEQEEEGQENLMVLEDEGSMDDFIVEDNPNDLGNIEAQKELSKMLGDAKRHRNQSTPKRHPAFGFEDSSIPHSRVMNEAWEFRNTVGSIMEASGAPAVEFLNYVCEVLGLEKELEIQILSLKKSCLFFLDTPETQELTEFKEPSGSLLIPNTICPQCQNQVDLDLCHTDVLYEREKGEESEIGGGRPLLVCQLCGGQYEHEIMEAALLEACARKIDGAQMQDLKCQKCSCVKNTEMGQGCDVCGNYKGHNLTVGTEERPNAAKNLLSNSIDLKVMLRVMKRVADQFHFEVLQDYVDMLQGYH